LLRNRAFLVDYVAARAGWHEGATVMSRSAFRAAGPAFPDIHPERGVQRLIVRGFPFVLAYWIGLARAG